MLLEVLGSSSQGNCYLLGNQSEYMMIECGVPVKEVQKAIDFNISKIAGAIITHEHGDHSKYTQKFLEKNIPCYMSKGTKESLKINHSFAKVMDELQEYHIGSFTVKPFGVNHDAKQPFGFLIYHKECGLVLFATDTYYLDYKFSGLNNVLIECNYRHDILQKNVELGVLPAFLKKRTERSHMEFDTCKDVLLQNDLSSVKNIVLIHLSPGNSNADEFKNDMEVSLNKPVHIASKGLKIEFNK